MAMSTLNTPRPPRFKTSDLVGAIGAAAVLIGMMIFKTGAALVPAWVAWLVAPLLWYAGFGMLVGWAMARMLAVARRPERKSATRTEHAAAPPKPAPLLASSSFAEHDFV
jgi:hypothetical protein